MVNYAIVAQRMAQRFLQMGGELLLNAEVTGLEETAEQVLVQSTQGELQCKRLIVCAGLMADRGRNAPSDFAGDSTDRRE